MNVEQQSTSWNKQNYLIQSTPWLNTDRDIVTEHYSQDYHGWKNTVYSQILKHDWNKEE
jgi:hypothetical protein